jgi:hypothetical protein
MKRYLVQWISNGIGYGSYFEDFGDATDYAQINGIKSKISDTRSNAILLRFQTIGGFRYGKSIGGEWLKIKEKY